MTPSAPLSRTSVASESPRSARSTWEMALAVTPARSPRSCWLSSRARRTARSEAATRATISGGESTGRPPSSCQCSTEPRTLSSRPSALSTCTLRSSTRSTHCVTALTVFCNDAGVSRALIDQ